MTKTHGFRKSLVIGLMLAAGTAHATLTTFFGENQSPNFTVSGSPVAAKSGFLANLTGTGSENFESFAVSTPGPIQLTFSGGGNPTVHAMLSGTGQIANNSSSGRFNTSAAGSQWWNAEGDLNLAFDTAISAFGFYGTDIGDFPGQLMLTLTDTNNVVTSLVVSSTLGGLDGALHFYGFIDNSKGYRNIAIGNTGNGTDIFGLDDIVVVAQVLATDPGTHPVSEPGVLALMLLGLAGVVAARKKPRPWSIR